jgi:hypothetical protein
MASKRHNGGSAKWHKAKGHKKQRGNGKKQKRRRQ